MNIILLKIQQVARVKTKAAKSKPSARKGIPAAKKQSKKPTKSAIVASETESEQDEPLMPKKLTKPTIVASETESDQDEPPITKQRNPAKNAPKKRVVATPEAESDQDEPPITKKRNPAKNAHKKRVVTAPEAESDQDELPMTKKRRVDKEKTAPGTAPMKVRKVNLTLSKPVETTRNREELYVNDGEEVCHVYFPLLYFQPIDHHRITRRQYCRWKLTLKRYATYVSKSIFTATCHHRMTKIRDWRRRL